MKADEMIEAIENCRKLLNDEEKKQYALVKSPYHKIASKKLLNYLKDNNIKIHNLDNITGGTFYYMNILVLEESD